MEQAHQLLAFAAAASAILTLAVALVVWRRPQVGRRLLDRVILAALVVIALTAGSGVVRLAAGAHPGDELHLIYGVVALLALPVGRFARGRKPPRPGIVVIAAAVLAGMVLRLFQTGA